MKLYLKNHGELYAVEQLQLQLFPMEPAELTEAPFRGDGAVSALYRGKTYTTAVAVITRDGKTARGVRRLSNKKAEPRTLRRILQQSYYLAAAALTGACPPWGALSGVRPTKLSTRFLQDGGTEAACRRMLRDTFFVTPLRQELCVDCSRYSVETLKMLDSRDLSLYIGIPFCPTRCAYCSFVSQSVEKFGSLLEPYVRALLREIQGTGELLRRSGFRIRSLYIGGGTPTTLNHSQLRELMAAVRDNFDLSRCLEFTVEGGRPDTLDFEKLHILYSGGADRVSINPQTMNDTVLEKIGRRHTTAQTLAAYRDAVNAGFTEINMDLIAGLPGDSPDSFRSSLEQVLALSPSNITVHTLALKKAADLYWERREIPDGAAVAQMLEEGNALLRRAGYEPYYLYRQKNTAGSFENVGWCKPGHPCRYNIIMMEEMHSILALGGGGMNKVNFARDDLERFHNPKYPKEYIERIENTLEKKKEIFRLLSRGRQTEE